MSKSELYEYNNAEKAQTRKRELKNLIKGEK